MRAAAGHGARVLGLFHEVADAVVRVHLDDAELVGRYRDVRQFLYELETASDFVIVDSIVLAEGDDAAAPLNLTMVVSTYFSAVSDAR